MKRAKVITAGETCLDLTPVFEEGTHESFDHIIMPGKVANVGPMNIHTGGSVSNTGLAMRFFGADVSLMGKIGDDVNGQIMLQEFEKHGGADGMIVAPGEMTSYSVVLAIPGIDRVFLHHGGANNTFCADDVNYETCREAVLFHFGYPPSMAGIFRNEGRELAAIFSRVKECGCLTSLDMTMVDVKSEAAQVDWKEILRRTLPNVDFFLPSFEELCFETDREHYESMAQRAGNRDITEVISVEEDVAPLAQEMLNLGCRLVIIKCGARGFYYRTAGAEAFAQLTGLSGIDLSGFADREGFQRAYVPKAVVSGTGAGDTTIAAFLTAMLSGYPFERCIALAAAAGASCVEGVDALSGLMPFDQLEKRIDAGWKQVLDFTHI